MAEQLVTFRATHAAQNVGAFRCHGGIVRQSPCCAPQQTVLGQILHQRRRSTCDVSAYTRKRNDIGYVSFELDAIKRGPECRHVQTCLLYSAERAASTNAISTAYEERQQPTSLPDFDGFRCFLPATTGPAVCYAADIRRVVWLMDTRSSISVGRIRRPSFPSFQDIACSSGL